MFANTRGGMTVFSVVRAIFFLGLVLDRASATTPSPTFDTLTPDQRREALADLGTKEGVNACLQYAVARGACDILSRLPVTMSSPDASRDCDNKNRFFNQMNPEQQQVCNTKYSGKNPHLEASLNSNFKPAIIIPLPPKNENAEPVNEHSSGLRRRY